MPRSSKNTSLIAVVVVLAGVDEHRSRTPRRSSASMTGLIFMKFGRAPATHIAVGRVAQHRLRGPRCAPGQTVAAVEDEGARARLTAS